MEYLQRVDYRAEGFGQLYDELPLWSAPFGLMLLERVPIGPHLTILDVGAGTGWLSIELAQRCGPHATVVAVDPWKVGLDRLRWKIDRLALTNIVVLEGDAADVDLPDGSVDVIVSNLGINNFDDPAGVLRTCSRVARPNAALCLTTNIIGHMAEFYAVYRETLTQLGQHDRLAALDAHIDRRGTADSVTRRLDTAGFEVREVSGGAFTMRFANGSSLLRHHFIRLGFVPDWAAVASPEAVERTFDTLERNLNAVAQARGGLTLTIPMACLVALKRPGVAEAREGEPR